MKNALGRVLKKDIATLGATYFRAGSRFYTVTYWLVNLFGQP
jgi:hypothetical protein